MARRMGDPGELERAIEARLFPFPAEHFLSADDLSCENAERLLDLADAFADWNAARPAPPLTLLAGYTAAHLFFENSTRTRASFELAAKRLGAHVLNLDIATSSTAKGETLVDTARTIDAMSVELMVVRHREDGAPGRVAQGVRAGVINAGDGTREHPTQALLDALTIRRAFGRIEGLTVAICGDIRHSRVAGSNARLLPRLGARVRLVGPPALLPEAAPAEVALVDDLRAGVAGADVVMMLRLQRERMRSALEMSEATYFDAWGLDREKLGLAAPGARVMHPGPMNRGVEIAGAVADDETVSLISAQVGNGVAARMAVLAALALRFRAPR
jgi:aspartate carbamoyltransferase catalytic subunit